MKKENNMINQEYHIETLEQINNEKNQLVNNIQILANEVDELGDKNREYEDYIQKNTELKNYSDLYKQYFKVEKENQDIKKIVEMQNRKNCLNYGNKKIFQNYLDNPKTMKNLGKFDLEKEENFVDLGFFGCGVTK
jgi:predicted nuclease with TOPRIM domain